QLFESGRHVDAVAIDVVSLDDDVAYVHANSKGDGCAVGNCGVPLGNSALDAYRALHGVHGTGELDQCSVTHELHQTAVVLGDDRIDQAAAYFLECTQRSRLVRTHQPAVADHVGRHYGSKTP